MRDRVAVAISTTGQPHRLGFLETAVRHWDAALREGDSLFVTVDGSYTEAAKVAERVAEWTSSVFRVGQPFYVSLSKNAPTRVGVAANKNTGLELMMDQTKARHLFLCDDDAWPLYPASVDKHVDMPMRHSIVAWGRSRLIGVSGPYAEWNWPRGVAMYVDRRVVEVIGGMDERFGAGGHEHAEWSQRIFNAGLTPAPFISPASYATRGATGASILWHAEDVRAPGEGLSAYAKRKAALTTIKRDRHDWSRINAVMAEREGDASFVPYTAAENRRQWATLCPSTPSQGADT